MEREDEVLVRYWLGEICERLDDINRHLPESFKYQFNDLRYVSDWLDGFRIHLDNFIVQPF